MLTQIFKISSVGHRILEKTLSSSWHYGNFSGLFCGKQADSVAQVPLKLHTYLSNQLMMVFSTGEVN